MTDNPLLKQCLQIADGEEPTFAHPWEAKAFAIVVQLSAAGHFSWPEWVETFSDEVKAATAIEAAGGPAPSYYEQWLTAAEKLVIAKNITSPAQLAAKRFAAGIATPPQRVRT